MEQCGIQQSKIAIYHHRLYYFSEERRENMAYYHASNDSRQPVKNTQNHYLQQTTYPLPGPNSPIAVLFKLNL